jgi:hypothetical protein
VEHFLETAPPATTEPGSDVLFEDHTPSYLKVLSRSSVDANTWYSAYLIRIDDHTSAAVTCWGQQFDVAFQQFADSKYGHVYLKEFRKIWPTFFELIDHAIDERYGDGALTELIDPDDVNRKWFIAVLVSGSGSADDQEQRRLEAADVAVALSLAVTREIHTELTWKVKAKIAMGGGAVGLREGQAIRSKWEGRLNWLQPLIGG